MIRFQKKLCSLAIIHASDPQETARHSAPCSMGLDFLVSGNFQKESLTAMADRCQNALS